MSFKSIPTSMLATGKAISQGLLKLVRNNFDTHHSRLSELESGVVNLFPTGTIVEYGGAAAPSGFLLCDGSAVSQTTYAALFAIVGYTHGNPGGGNFYLPDMRGRIAVGAGTGSGLTARTLGDSFGVETVALAASELPAHTHSWTETAHSHPDIGYWDDLGAPPYYYHGGTNGASTTPVRQTDPVASGVTLANKGSGSAHTNIQPSCVVNFLIKT